jgi:uncharacterized repeat protein (TIGR01451 family)/fimbrial isopeptide formation D2 family protein
VSTSSLVQGQTSVWTLNLETSEYAVSTGPVTVTDVVPSGLDIASSGAPTPTQTSNADGTITLTWTLPGYAAKDGTSQLTYTTTTRASYRGTTNPVAAQDSWTNNVTTSATATLRTGATSTAPSPVTDASSASQQAGPISISKKVLQAPASVSADCSGVDPTVFVADASGSGDAPYHWGDTVCWLLTVDFPGALNTLNTSVQDLLPAGFSYRGYYATSANDVSITSAPPVTDSGTETLESWGINNADQGTTFQVVVASAVTAVTAAAPTGSIQGNLMKVSYANTAGSIFQLRDAAKVNVSRPLLTIAKTASPTSGAAGSVVAFSVIVTNSGTQAAVAQVVDALPTGLACATVAVPSGASCTGSTMTWNSVTVAASGSTTLTYSVTLPVAVGAGDSFTNTVTVPSYTSTTNTGGTETYTDSPVPSASATVTVPAATVTKTATPIARIGDTVTWVVTGHIPAMTTLYSSPALVDTVPSGYVVTGATATLAGSATPATTSGSTVTVRLGAGTSYVNSTASEQQVVATITGRLTDTSANRLGVVTTNSATLSWTGTSSGASRTATGTAATTVVEPRLAMTKSDNAAGKAIPGATVTYTLTVNNTGTSTAYDTVITDTVPIGVTPQKAGGGVAADGDTVAGTGAGIWSAATRTVTFPTRDIAASGQSAITLIVTVDDPLTSNGSIVNNAGAITTSQPGADPNERTSASTRNTGYTITASDTLSNPVIGITKSASRATATIGDDVSYTITVTVPASTVADNVTVVDSLPAGIFWQSLTSSSCVEGGSPCALTASVVGTPTASDRTIAYFLGDVTTAASDRVVTIVYLGRVAPAATPGAMTNTARLRFDAPGSPPFAPTTIADVTAHSYATTGSSANATVTEQEPALGIVKRVTGIAGSGAHLLTTPPRAVPGDVIAYTVTVTNSGTWPAYDAIVSDPLPAGVDCTWVGSVSNGGTCTNAILSWQLAGPLAPGAGNAVPLSYTLTVPVGTSNSVFPGTAPELPNTADIPSYFAEPAGTRGATVGQYKQYTEDPHSTATVQLDLATLSGNITEDWDISGSKTAGDLPLANVPVTVTYAGADGLIGTSDDETFSTQTDAAGDYSVINLPGGTYRVTVAAATVAAAGLTGSWDADGGALGVWNGTVTENGNRAGVDFGYKGTGSIGDTVWFDQNADGSQAPTEPGIPGATVTLTWTDTGKTLTTTTGATGGYSFGNLPAGGYTVVVTPPTGYHAASDPDTGTTNPDASSTVVLAAGQNDPTQDFGLAGSLSLGDLVWLDRDSNGSQGIGEPGVPQAQVTIAFTPAGGMQTGRFTTTTDSTGRYTVGNLPPGDYTVTVNPATLPAGATPTHDLDGVGTPNTTAVTLSTVDRHDANFGYDATRSLGGTVWWDYTGDHNPADGPGLGGITVDVTYYGPDGVPGGGDDISYTSTTAPDGTWALNDVSQGNYGVAVDPSTVPAGLSPTFDSDGATNGLGASEVTVPASGLTPPQNFGYAGSGSIGDLVFLDRNRDGQQSTTSGQEPGVGGVQVALSTVIGGQTMIITTTTSPTGAYSFPGLPAGDYTASITTPTGFAAVSDLDGGDHSIAAVLLSTGQVRTDADFGLAGTASLAGIVYNDRNADGTQAAGEPGVPGVTMTATGSTSAGTIILTTVTGADGSWSFPALPVGQWTVAPTANVPSGYTEVSESDGSVDASITTTLAAGQTVTGQLFGYRGSGSIGDTVFLDQNGTHSATGQPGVPAQEVDMTWAGPDGDLSTAADNQSFTTTTDASGNYLFPYLPNGLFRVTVVGGITASATNTGDPDGGTPNTSQLTLAGVAPSNLAQDFGYAAITTPGSNALGDLVWWDLNGNGVRNGGEPGIPGATVTARWYGPDGLPNTADDIVLTTTTDANGAYGFQGLPDGTYAVTVTGGVYPGLAPSADTADGPLAPVDGSSTVTLTGGVTRSDVDFGDTGTGSIGDHVYLDENGDGMQGSDEPGIPGATVTLIWAGPDGIPGNADDRTFTENTGADGSWLGDRLPAGGYTVTVTGTPVGLANSGDPDGGGDSTSQLTLSVGQNRLDEDFGYHGTASVGDTVFVDVDGNGVQTGNEPGAAGVVVTVTTAGSDGILGDADDIVATRTTDADGRYSVDGLPAGAVRVS